VAQLYPQALGSLYVASYDLQGYGIGILTCLHAYFHILYIHIYNKNIIKLLCLLPAGLLWSYSSVLKMKTIYSSVTPVDFYQTTWHHIVEGRLLHRHRCENIKSNKELFFESIMILNCVSTIGGSIPDQVIEFFLFT
jgi:hypothetical protein